MDQRGGQVAGRDAPTLLDTFAALARPRLAIPILLVCAPMLAAQARYSSHAFSVPLAALMCVAFVAVAPASWRRCAGRGTRGLLAHGAIGLGCVIAIGAVAPRALGMPLTFLTHDTSLAVEVALFWVGGWGLGRDIDLERTLERERARAQELERQAEHAQLLAMRSHLDPHFLFNTLNAIAEHCRRDGETAERAVLELSALLRRILPAMRQPTWSLAEEIALVDGLWSLHHMRDPSRFTIARHVPDELPRVAIPSLLLVPLAENCMTHGPSAGHRGPVGLRVSAGDATLRIQLDNPGPYGGRRRGGSGLDLVRNRLELAYGDRASFHIGPTETGTRAVVYLPMEAA